MCKGRVLDRRPSPQRKGGRKYCSPSGTPRKRRARRKTKPTPIEISKSRTLVLVPHQALVGILPLQIGGCQVARNIFFFTIVSLDFDVELFDCKIFVWVCFHVFCGVCTYYSKSKSLRKCLCATS